MGGKGGGHGPSPKAANVESGKSKKKGLAKGFLNNGSIGDAKGNATSILSSIEGDSAKKKGKAKSKNSSCSDRISSSGEDSDENFSILSDEEREFEAMAERGLTLEQMEEEIVKKFSNRPSHRSRSPKKNVQQSSKKTVHVSAKEDLDLNMAEIPSNSMKLTSNFSLQQSKSTYLEVSNSNRDPISHKSQATVHNLEISNSHGVPFSPKSQATVHILDFSNSAIPNSNAYVEDSLANSSDVMLMECVAPNSPCKETKSAAIVSNSDCNKVENSAKVKSYASDHLAATSLGKTQVNSMLCAAMELDKLNSSNSELIPAFYPQQQARNGVETMPNFSNFQQNAANNSVRFSNTNSPLNVDNLSVNCSPHTGPSQNVGMAINPQSNVSQTASISACMQGARQNASNISWADSMEVEHGKLNADAPAFIPPHLHTPMAAIGGQLQQAQPSLGSGQQGTLVGNQDKPPNAWAKKSHVRVNPQDRNPARTVGGPIQLDMEAIHANLARLERGLVGKLLGKRLPFWVLKGELQKRWEQFGEFTLTTVSADCFICIFKHAEARDDVLLGGPWHIMGHIVALDRWTPNFDPASMKGLTAPIWVRLPALPLLYWDNSSITRISEAVGEPIYIDGQTAQWERSAFARVCVKVDLSQKLPPGVMVSGLDGDFWQPFEYEGISHFCFHCGRVGHRISTCPARPPAQSTPLVMSRGRQPLTGPQQSMPSLKAASQPTGRTSSPTPPPPATLPVASPTSVPPDATRETQPEHGYGPWTLVQRRKPRVPKHHAGQPLPRTSVRHTVPAASTSPPQPAAIQDVPPQCVTDDSTAQPATPMEQQTETPHQQPGPTLRDKLRRLRSRSGAERVSRAYLDKLSRELGPLLPSHSRRRRPPMPPESRATSRHRSPDAS